MAEQLDGKKFTIGEVCSGMGVPPERVQVWVKRGLLKAERITGHPLLIFRRCDLRRFLLAYPGHWDHRPADRWSLLDILCGDRAALASCKAALAA